MALNYEQMLRKEIDSDREAHGKKPLKDKDDDDHKPGGGSSDKFEDYTDTDVSTIVMDAGYKNPAIAKLLIDDGIKPLFPYRRPMTKDGFFSFE